MDGFLDGLVNGGIYERTEGRREGGKDEWMDELHFSTRFRFLLFVSFTLFHEAAANVICTISVDKSLQLSRENESLGYLVPSQSWI